MSVQISVIVPVYKVEEYIDTCLQSALSQDFDSFEIIAVDDGSPDRCGAILDEYAAKDSRVTVVHQQNQGLGGARNTGIAYANGEYLLFLDSDDSLQSGALAYLYQTAKEKDADIVWFGIDYVDQTGTVTDHYQASASGVRVVTQDEEPLLFADNSYICNKFFRKSLFDQTGILFPPRAWYEDLHTLPKLVLAADRIALTDRTFYNYLQRADSIMHDANVARVSEMMDAVQDVVTYYKQQGAYEHYYESLEYMTALHVMVFAALRVSSVDPKNPLLLKFYQFTVRNFPGFQKNAKIKECFTFRHKLIFAFSKHKCFYSLFLLSKLNQLRKHK